VDAAIRSAQGVKRQATAIGTRDSEDRVSVQNIGQLELIYLVQDPYFDTGYGLSWHGDL
jgi:hypothetical protein